jgi:hypothetical protein
LLKIVLNCEKNAYQSFGNYPVRRIEDLDGYKYFFDDNNTEWLDVEGIKKYIAPFEELFTQGKLEG